MTILQFLVQFPIKDPENMFYQLVLYDEEIGFYITTKYLSTKNKF